MRSIFIIISVLFFSIQNFAQTGSMWSLQWEAALPVGETRSLMKNNSYKGISFEYKKCFRQNIIYGGRVAYNSFYENKGLSTIEIDNTLVSGYFQNYMNIVPIMLTAGYLFNNRQLVPYAGLGVGTYYIQSKSITGSQTYITENAWHFGFSPEVGLTIPFIVSNFGLNLNAKYNYAVKTKNTPGHSWFSFGIGLSFMY